MHRIFGLALVTGVVAVLVGIGGGMVMGPLLLSVGLHPASAAASATVMVLLSASSASLQLVCMGVVPVYYYALVFGTVCLVAAAVGVGAARRLLKATGRPSILALILAAVVTACAVVVGVTYLTGLA